MRSAKKVQLLLKLTTSSPQLPNMSTWGENSLWNGDESKYLGKVVGV